MTTSSGVSYVQIRSLDKCIDNSLLVGVIIAMQAPKTVTSRKDHTERATWGFTFRDSPNDCINVSVWGDREFVYDLASNFHLGDIVELANPRVNSRRMGDTNENYVPSVTSSYQLNIIEGQTTLHHYTGADNLAEILPLLQCLTKPSCDFFTLADIHAHGGKINEDVNLLVAVRRVGAARSIKTKDGRDLAIRDVTVLDQTDTGLTLSLWNAELVLRADFWKPRQTVLFLADVRVSFNNYRKEMSASDGPRTIITENPETAEAEALRSYAKTVPFETGALIDSLSCSIPDASSIRNVMSIQQLVDRASSSSGNSGGDDMQFTALLYCLITKLDLDGSSPTVITKCLQCQKVVDGPCTNKECPTGSGNARQQFVCSFDLRVTLSDHTGSVEFCRLTGSSAEKVLGCTAAAFSGMSLDERTALKWKFLLERCATRVLVLRSKSDRPHPVISVLACAPADPNEVAARIPAY